MYALNIINPLQKGLEATGNAASQQSPTKNSIRSQIDNASHQPDGYAERAKLVYKVAEKEGWTRETTLQMLKDPVKFARFTANVSFILSSLIRASHMHN
jgi:hypothetical protein